MLGGSGYALVNGEKYNISKNTFMYFPFETKYILHYENASEVSVAVINFDLTSDYSDITQSRGTANELSFDPAYSIRYPLPAQFENAIIGHMPQLSDLILRCTNEFLNKNAYYREISSSLVKQCLIRLLREYSPDSDSVIANKIINYIHENYQNCELTNTVISENFSYHPYYLSRIMRYATGDSLHAYLTKYRIRMAKNYLVTTDLDISTVAWKSGFSSSAHFIKIFKQLTGITPKKYRSTHFMNDI